MDDTSLYGEILKPLHRPKPKDQARPARRSRQNASDDRRADRTAAFYERHAPEAHPAETAWRHSCWAAKRERVLAAMQRCNVHPTTIWNMRQCGSCCTAEWSELAGRRRLTAYYCKSRHCEPCARSKANKIAANLRARLENGHKHQFRFLTLTLKHNTAPLRAQVDRLYKAFKKLRSTPVWQKAVRGGCVILEVKHNGKCWHPHLHACIDGGWLDAAWLSRAWLKVTGDSYIVDVKLISRGRDAAAYVSKYITKSTNDCVWADPSRATEWITASKGVRTANTFGSWRRWPLLAVTQPYTDWKAEDRLVSLLRRATAGERVARDIIYSLRPNSGIDETHHCEQLATPPAESVPAERWEELI